MSTSFGKKEPHEPMRMSIVLVAGVSCLVIAWIAGLLLTQVAGIPIADVTLRSLVIGSVAIFVIGVLVGIAGHDIGRELTQKLES